MKNYTQVYVKNSMEAAATSCKAFGAEITFENIEYLELGVGGNTPGIIKYPKVIFQASWYDEVYQLSSLAFSELDNVV